MWEQYRGYNKKHAHNHTLPSAVVLENVLGVVGKQQQQHRLVNSSSSSSADIGTSSTLLGPVPVDDKYIPKTIIRREYNGHAHQELFTVYITSYAHHPQAFTAQCGSSLIETMQGRNVMFKYFQHQDEDQLSSILGSTGTGSMGSSSSSSSNMGSVIAKQQNLEEQQLVAA